MAVQKRDVFLRALSLSAVTSSNASVACQDSEKSKTACIHSKSTWSLIECDMVTVTIKDYMTPCLGVTEQDIQNDIYYI